MACRSKTIALSTKFHSPAEADKHYNSQEETSVTPRVSSAGTSLQSSEIFEECKRLVISLPSRVQLAIITELFSWLDVSQHDDALFPPDFLEFVFQAAQQLQKCGRVNILYLLGYNALRWVRLTDPSDKNADGAY